jgi:D-alanyl-lipoteichoic acid acyltransferase DltB (MBOAT superfamily)
LIKRVGRQGLRNYLQSKKIHALAVVATFHYVCLTILFFPSDLEKTFHILKSALQVV